MMTEHAAAHLLVVDDVSGAPVGVLSTLDMGTRAGGAKPAMSRRGAGWARHAHGLVLAAAGLDTRCVARYTPPPFVAR